MTNIDFILAGGLVLLLIIVILRVFYLRKRLPIEDKKEFAVKEPRRSHIKENPSEHRINEPAAREPARDFSRSDSENSAKYSKLEKETPSSKPDESFLFNDSKDPLTIIKTFSAPKEKRLKAIKEAGQKRMYEAVPALIEVLYEPDSTISLAAAESLGEIGDPRAIEPLLEVSRRSDAMLIREIPEEIAGTMHIGSEAEDAEMNEGSANPYNFKELVVFKIDQLPREYFLADGSPIPRKDLVVKGLQDNNQQMRQMAAKAAIGLDHEEIVEPLMAALDNPFEVESVRFMAAEALGGMQNEKSVECLLKALKDDNVAVRYSAAAALSGRKENRVINALIESLKDNDKYVRSSIAYALGASGEPLAMQALFSAVGDESEVVRFSAAKALAFFSADEVIDEVNIRLQAGDRRNIPVLLEVLGQIKDKRSVEILRKYLNDFDSEISYKASLALMGQENEDIIDDLIQASRRIDEELMRLIRETPGDFVSGLKSSVSIKNSTKELSLEDFKNLPPNLEKLRKGLMDKSPNIRGTAANTLADFNLEEAVQLLAAVVHDENEFVRSAAVNSLGRIKSFGAIDYIITMSGDASEEVRYAVVKALSETRELPAVECLRRMASSDRDKNVKRSARLAVEKADAS